MSEVPRYGRPLPPGRLLLLGLEEPPLGRRPRLLNAGLQGYLAHKKTQPPRTLPQAYS